MKPWLPRRKSAALRQLATEVFKEQDFSVLKTNIGIVATRWAFETPIIFKSSIDQAHGDRGTFEPGFGCKIGDAVEASCSAYPFFRKKTIITTRDEEIIVIDGGYCANNPTLYAIAEATQAFKVPRQHMRVVSIGVGEYPTPKKSVLSAMRWIGYLFTVRLLQKVLEINTKSMDQLRHVLFQDVATIRISNRYTEPEMATDLFEADLKKLDQLWQRGRQSFRENENRLQGFL